MIGHRQMACIANSIGPHGQRKPEPGALIWLTFNSNLSTMGFNDLLTDIEPQPQVQRLLAQAPALRQLHPEYGPLVKN